MLSLFQMETIILAALHEDLDLGDPTTDLLLLEDTVGEALIKTRSACVISGLEVAQGVFYKVDPTLEFTTQAKNGDWASAGTCIARIQGRVSSLLKAERTALNFLQHLCGIATHTHQFVQTLEGTGAHITDTRKTTPGLRLLEKQAVRDGGGISHRFNLGSAVMLKDNHLHAMGGIAPAVERLRQKLSHTLKIEVEADSLGQVQEALDAGVDIILLDNMSPQQVKTAADLIGNRAIVEASGCLKLDNVRAYAEAGAQYLSTSQITLGAPPVDIGLDFV